VSIRPAAQCRCVPVNSDVRVHVKTRLIQRPNGWRQKRFFWSRLPTLEIARMLANACGVERNSRTPDLSKRFRFLRWRLIAELSARGVQVPGKLLALRLEYPFPVGRWHKRLSELSNRSFDTDAQRRAFASLRSCSPVAGQLRR
jgi:hypothetical protein